MSGSTRTGAESEAVTRHAFLLFSSTQSARARSPPGPSVSRGRSIDLREARDAVHAVQRCLARELEGSELDLDARGDGAEGEEKASVHGSQEQVLGAPGIDPDRRSPGGGADRRSGKPAADSVA